MSETWVTPTTTTWTTKAMVLEFASPEALRMIFGTLGPQQQSARIDYQRTVPDLPPAPRRRRGLTGRRYRTARRAYGRTVRRWKKAGCPTRTTANRIYLPSVDIQATGPRDFVFRATPA